MGLRAAVGSTLRALGLHRVTVAFANAEARRAQRRAPDRWRAAVLGLIDDSSRPTLVAGALEPHAVPVIVCLWTRPDRLTAILDQLSAQSGYRVRLILWNNRPSNTAVYLAEIAARGVSGSLASIEFTDSESNVGGMARFIVARKLLLDGYGGAFITLDDDQDVSSGLVSDLMAHHAPNTCAGWWAWIYADDYWQRVPAKPGEDATYVGTGGAVFDTGIVHDTAFFSTIPAKYGFIEDLWASWWISSHGGRLIKVDTPIVLVQEELNQHHSLIDRKVEFARYLRAL